MSNVATAITSALFDSMFKTVAAKEYAKEVKVPELQIKDLSKEELQKFMVLYHAQPKKGEFLESAGVSRMQLSRALKAHGLDSADEGATELLWASERMKYAGAAVSVASAAKYAFGSMTIDSEANRFVIEDCSPELAAELKRLALKLTGN